LRFFRRGGGGGRKPDRTFEEELWSQVKAQVGAAGYSFDLDAEVRLRQLIHSSVQTLGPATRTVGPLKVRGVQNAFGRLADEAIAQAKLEARNLIRWGDIEKALKRLCPIFPICKKAYG
jgi:hypothetical protein